MQVIPGGQVHEERGLGPEAESPVELATEPIRRGVRHVLDWLVMIALIVLIWNFALADAAPRDVQMAPAVAADQRVLASRLSYLLASPKRGDIALVIDTHGRNSALQRVLALPGDEIELRGQQVLVNGTAQNEPVFLVGVNTAQPERNLQFVLSADEYFVAMDNLPFTANTASIRATGQVKRQQILGRAWLSYWPPDAFGFVKSDRR